MIIQQMVANDLNDRAAFGLKKYGKPVIADDPDEDWLEHVYQEALDLCVYLKAEIERRKAAK